MGIAKKVIGELTFDLKRLQKDAKTVEAITKEISGYARKASTSFKELGRVIDSSFSRSIDKYKTHYKTLEQITRQGSMGRVRIIREVNKQELQELQIHAKKLEDELRKIQGKQEPRKKYGNLIEALGYRTDWFVSGTIFYGSIRSANKLVDVIKQTEYGMIELQKVMQDQATDFNKLQKDLLNLGQAYGFLNKEVLDVATIWAQAGMRQGEIEELTRVTLLNMNVGMMDAEESARYLLATLKQFNMETRDAIKIVDMVNEVSNNYAVTNRDLLEALTVTGNTAKNVGLSIEELIGHITALSESTAKSGAEIGNALKTIYSYIYRPATINVFEKLGIQVRDGADGFRDLNAILKDVQKVWREMTEQQQTELVVSLEETEEAWKSLSQAEQYELSMSAAGVRRRNFFISLIESMSTALEATSTAHNSVGSAMRENEKFMESYQKKIDQLLASLQELAVLMGETGLLEILKENVDTMKLLVDWYIQLPDAVTGVTNKVVLLSGAFLMLNAACRVFLGQGLIGALIARTTALASAAAGAQVATHTLGQSLLFFAQAPLAVIGPWGLMIGALAALTGAVISAKKEQAKQREEMEKTLQTLGNVKSDYDTHQQQLSNLQIEYNNLTQQLKGLNKGSEEYANVMDRIKAISKEMYNVKQNEYTINNQIADILPNAVLQYDRLGNAVRIAWNEVDRLIEKHKELSAVITGRDWSKDPVERARTLQNMLARPDIYMDLYRKEFSQKLVKEGYWRDYITGEPKLKIETSPGVYREMTAEQYAQWRYQQEKRLLQSTTSRTSSLVSPSPGGTPSPGGGAGGTAASQLLRNELQQLQFYLEATKLPATVLGRDLDVLGQTFNELTEDIKKNGLTLDDIAKLYSLSTEKAELLRQKQEALAESNTIHQRELENIVRQIEAMVPGFTDASFTADDLRIAMDRMGDEGREALKTLIQEHNRLSSEIHNTAMEIRKLEREASSVYGTIESLIKEKMAGAYRYQEQIAIDSLKRTQEAEERALQQRIDNYDRYMQKRIDAIQEEIDAIDELMQKYRDQDREEDYRNRIMEIEAEIAQIKADKRYEFITETGERILTYDVASVTELEKRKVEIEEEYARYRRDKALEEEKRKLENKKRALEDERRTQLEAYKKQQQDLRDHHNEQMRALQFYWQEQQTQEQIHQQTMRLIEQNGYEEALRLQERYFRESEAAYRQHQAEMYSIGGSIAKQYSGGKGGGTTSGLTETEKKFVKEFSTYSKHVQQKIRETLAEAGNTKLLNALPKYHTGGIAGAEGLAWLKRGEIVIPKEIYTHLPIATKSHNLPRDITNQYGAVYITVNANDWQQFMRSIPPAIRARIGGT